MYTTRLIAAFAAFAACCVTAQAATIDYWWGISRQSSTVTRYAIQSGGAINAEPATTVKLGFVPRTVVVSPENKSLYIADATKGLIWHYVVQDGHPLLATPANYQAKGLRDLAIDEGNQRVYALRGDGILSFRIGNEGHLTSLADKPVMADSDSVAFAVSPDGTNIYTACDGKQIRRRLHPSFPSGSLCQFSVTGGNVSPLDPLQVGAGTGPIDVAVDPVGPYVFAVSAGTQSLHPFRVVEGGALVSLDVDTIPLDIDPVSVFVEPKGRFVYVLAAAHSQRAAHSIVGFHILSSGDLEPITSHDNAPGYSQHLFSDSNGQYLYVTGDNDRKIQGYKIEADGQLTTLSGS